MKLKKLPQWKVRNLVLSGMFIAIGIVLPIAFHMFGGLGPKLLPMQFPILLGAYFLCPQYAVAVGVLTPILSGIITGMPPIFPAMPCLAIEFGAYALFLSILKLENKYLRLLATLILGKIVLLAFALTNPVFWAFAISQLTNGLLGMTWQIVLIPIVAKGIEGLYVGHNKTSKN